LLREVIEATGRSKTEIAALLGISRQHLYDILAERKPVSSALARECGCACRAPMTRGGPNGNLPTKSERYPG
jgi:hypothetical protein